VRDSISRPRTTDVIVAVRPYIGFPKSSRNLSLMVSASWRAVPSCSRSSTKSLAGRIPRSLLHRPDVRLRHISPGRIERWGPAPMPECAADAGGRLSCAVPQAGDLAALPCFRDGRGDLVGGLAQRIVGQVGVALRR